MLVQGDKPSFAPRENLASYHPAVFPGDIGLALVDALQPAEALSLLEQRRLALVNDLHQARSAPAHAGSPQWVVEHKRRHLACELEWLDEVMDGLRKIESGANQK